MEPYRPSNSCEGAWFEGQFCEKCEENRAWQERGDAPCDIQCRALALSIGEEGYPEEWVSNEEGPLCTAFRPLGSGTAEQAAADQAKYEAAMAEMQAARTNQEAS